MKALLVLVLAFWPVWKWYLARSTDGSDEPWGILALATAAVYLAVAPKKTAESRPGFEIPLPALAALGVYVLCFDMLPALVRAALALACLVLTLSPLLFLQRIHLGLSGLLLLSLPIIASLQFYAGYPLRALTGQIVSFLIGFTGESVIASGTSLIWRGDVISIDAPCSGIKMLWGGLYVSFALACFSGLTNYQTWLSYIFSSITIFLANVTRTYVLFFTETRIIEAPGWFHGAAGILFFALALLLIVAFNSMLRGKYEVRRNCIDSFCRYTPTVFR